MALIISKVWLQNCYKLGRSHLMANTLNRLPNQTKLVGVLNQTCDAHLFTFQPEWLQNVYEYLL
jgi:hypothetical protein